jgi:predicted metal-dependent phosphoesterase TrpH
MRRTRSPLLAELHAHTTWSDGTLTVRELVDLLGVRGFDVLCITDHVVRRDDPWLGARGPGEVGITPERYVAYLAEVAREAVRARSLYDLLLVPGLELTYNDREPRGAAHAVAIGLREHVDVDGGIEDAVRAAARAGAALVAAHPYQAERAVPRARLTQRWAHDEGLRRLAHRFELFNRDQLYGWVADRRLPCVAAGDVHQPAHVTGWKTLIPCAKDEEAVVAHLRSSRPVYLARVEDDLDLLAA